MVVPTMTGFLNLPTLQKNPGYKWRSVKNLTALLLGFRISKSAQTSNWEASVFNEKQISYAATDAWVCLNIYKIEWALAKKIPQVAFVFLAPLLPRNVNIKSCSPV